MLEEPPHEHDHPQGQHHAHPSGHGPHRHIGELITIVEQARLSPWVRERAVRAFQLLGEAEGRIHGLPADQVPLHEVGAVDALIDLVGASKDSSRWASPDLHRPVPLGVAGFELRTGDAVPAPATSILLEGIEIGPNGPVTANPTPTGAVLLVGLVLRTPPPRDGGAAAAEPGEAGGRNPKDYPKALRLILVGRTGGRRGGPPSPDLDDLSPEFLDPLREAPFWQERWTSSSGPRR